MKCDCECHRTDNPFVAASYAEDTCGRCRHGMSMRGQVIFLCSLVAVMCLVARFAP